MHQQNQNEDNLKPYKPSVLSLFTRDLCELPEVYPYDMAQNVPEQAVEPVDTFINTMLSYSRFHPSVASEWLISDEEMFWDQGLYSQGIGDYVDLDQIVDDIDRLMEGF